MTARVLRRTKLKHFIALKLTGLGLSASWRIRDFVEVSGELDSGAPAPAVPWRGRRRRWRPSRWPWLPAAVHLTAE